jgi:hypothetical protein
LDVDYSVNILQRISTGPFIDKSCMWLKKILNRLRYTSLVTGDLIAYRYREYAYDLVLFVLNSTISLHL